MTVEEVYWRLREIQRVATKRDKRRDAAQRARDARSLEHDLWRDVLYAIATWQTEDPAREVARMALGTLGVEFDREVK